MPQHTPAPPITMSHWLTMHRTTCARCTSPLHLAHQAERTIRRLDGVWQLRFSLLRCLNPQCIRFRTLCRPETEGAWALPHGTFGFDVIALVGQLRYAQHRSIPESIRSCGRAA
jgi:hypothetical protein